MIFFSELVKQPHPFYFSQKDQVELVCSAERKSHLIDRFVATCITGHSWLFLFTIYLHSEDYYLYRKETEKTMSNSPKMPDFALFK